MLGQSFALLSVLTLALWLLPPPGNPPQLRDERSHLATFDAAWQLAGEHFFDPEMNGVDWDAARERHRPEAAAARTDRELSRIINAMLGELRTSHTGHYTPEDVEYYHLLDIMGRAWGNAGLVERRFPEGIRYEGIEAWLQSGEGEMLITSIWPGGNAERAGLRTGDVITAVDGRPPAPITSFRGFAGERVEISFLRSEEALTDTAVLEVTWIHPKSALLHAQRASVRIIEHDGQRIGYIQVLSYAGQQYQDHVLEAIFGAGHLSDADALILDIRGGWGGATPSYLDPFLPGPTMMLRGRDGRESMVLNRWRKPIAMLTDEGTRSGKEILAFGLREHNPRGVLIGERTAGAVVAGRLFALPGGSVMYLALADVEVDGTRLEGSGVEPDIHVPFERRFAAGADPQLDRAVAMLAEMAIQGEPRSQR